ncbi:hypothetical protein [Emticicia sp. C21]|uniref:hypothetical protein n=1 Tax=Emticicia sp. C21 TaxID=2302915 RepID=UPI000E351DD7|nr:hypothetical protein [Emticicia sp. C21]RFS18472.1 hypothetical protein D0T08_04270 [Emticicia sp. C21]
MKKLALLLLIGFMAYQPSYAQKDAYVIMDIVKVKNGLWNEALYFFENNWKLYREDAIKQGIISSYKLLVNKADSVSNNIVLITEYPDSLSYRKSEENFRPILKKFRPNGPAYLNEKKRNDFMEIVVFNSYRVWTDDKEKRK